MTSIWFAGLSTGFGLIVAIGAQNIFVLTQGMSGRHLVVVPLICFLCDVILMTLGVGGFGSVLALNEGLTAAAAAGGAIFLAFYGFRSLRAAFRNTALVASSASAAAADGGMPDGQAPGGATAAVADGSARGSEAHGTFKAVLFATLAVTLLNPHVYLDSIVLMGGIGSRFPLPDRWVFLAGALGASLVWFFGLSLFGRLLAPVLGKPKVWRVLQAAVCALLWSQAFGLGRFALASLASAG